MFYIQACNPVNNGEYDENDNKLMEAIETVFPMMTENAIMVWNYICIPLSYKYDISYMINDIIIILNNLMTKRDGVITNAWLPDTFYSKWIIKWEEDIIEINASWQNVVGDIIENLNREPNIKMNKWDFINEWERVFFNIKIALNNCGYNEENLKDMSKFIKLYSSFKNKGILYKN